MIISILNSFLKLIVKFTCFFSCNSLPDIILLRMNYKAASLIMPLLSHVKNIVLSLYLACKIEFIESHFPVISCLCQLNVCDILCYNHFFLCTVIFSIHVTNSSFHRRHIKAAIVVASQVSYTEKIVIPNSSENLDLSMIAH